MHYWADLQSVHGFRCYNNIAPNAKCQRVLALGLCLVPLVFDFLKRAFYVLRSVGCSDRRRIFQALTRNLECGFVNGMADYSGRKTEEPRTSGKKVATLRTTSHAKPALIVVCTCNNIDMDRFVITTSTWLLASRPAARQFVTK